METTIELFECKGCKAQLSSDGFYTQLAHSGKYRLRYKRCKQCQNAASKRLVLMRKYGITPEGYAALLAQANGRCAICGAEETNRLHHRLSIDHCHATGRIRGLLCHRCNVALGQFDDDAERLRRAAAYLEDSQN